MKPEHSFPTYLQRLKLWMVSLTERPSSQYWLGFISFVESSVFPLPTDILFVPMVILKREKAFHYAFIATLFSVFGGIFGYLIGYFAFEAVAKPILEFYGGLQQFEALRSQTSMEIIFILLLSSGFTHLPPIKIVTILAGVVAMDLWIFLIAAVIARGGRFYLLAWLIERYGTAVVAFMKQRFKWLVVYTSLIVIFVYLFYLFLK